jgi:hypothetical protein
MRENSDSLSGSLVTTVAVLLGLYGLSLPVGLVVARLVSPDHLFLGAIIGLVMVMSLFAGGMHRAIRRPTSLLRRVVVLGYVAMVATVLVVLL